MGTFGFERYAVTHAGNEFVLNEGLPTKGSREMTVNGQKYSYY